MIDLHEDKERANDTKNRLHEKCCDYIQEMYQNTIKDYVFEMNPLYQNKMLFYSILKTEGDIFIEMRDFERAIQAYKCLKNYCKKWDMIEQEMWICEQIGFAYRMVKYHELAIDFFKI